jgi:hypothetical protein
MAMFRKLGLIKYNQGGPKFDWRVKFKLPLPKPIAGDMQPHEPQRRSLVRTAELDWRGYELSEAISKFEKLQQQGSKVKLFDLVEDATKSLTEGMVNFFHKEFYNDGYTNTDSIHGFESWLNFTNGAKAAVAADTYAGLSTILGTYGGSWLNGTYPEGDCNNTPEYIAWTPLGWDYTASEWDTDGTSFKETAPEVLRTAIFHNKKRDYPLDVIILDGELYTDFLNAISEKERIQVTRGAGGSLAIKLGFDAINYDGVDVVTEWGVPTGVGYGLSLRNKAIQLCSMQDQLFVADKDDDWSTKTHRLSLDFYGNLMCKTPRATCKFLAI